MRPRAHAPPSTSPCSPSRVQAFDGVIADGRKTIRYTPFYGLNHLNRPFDASGGWCPQRGGDWGSYPSNPGGSGFQNEYEESTPLCDAVVIDVKLWANLDAPSWNTPLFQQQVPPRFPCERSHSPIPLSLLNRYCPT